MKLINWTLLTTLTVVMLNCASNKATTMNNNPVHIGITELDFTIASGKRMHAYIWYPTLEPSDQKDFITSQVMQEEMSRQFGMPKFSISTKATTNATVNAKIINISESSDRLPVVFFSHGFVSFARQNNHLMEYLAKNGLIVVALSNPKETLVTEYTDGQFVKTNRSTSAMQIFENMTKKRLKEISQEISSDFNAIKHAQDNTQYLSALKQLGNNSLFSQYAPYVQSGSDNLVQSIKFMQTSSNDVVSRMDFSKLALIGHSLGGLISVDANRVLKQTNQHAKVVISLDSPPVLFNFQSTSLDDFYVSPHCAFQGGFTKLGKQNIGITDMAQHGILNSKWGGCTIDSSAAHHNNYTDLTYIGMLKWFGLTGKVHSKKFGTWMNQSSLAIMEHYLYNTSQYLDISTLNSKHSDINIYPLFSEQ